MVPTLIGLPVMPCAAEPSSRASRTTSSRAACVGYALPTPARITNRKTPRKPTSTRKARRESRTALPKTLPSPNRRLLGEEALFEARLAGDEVEQVVARCGLDDRIHRTSDAHSQGVVLDHEVGHAGQGGELGGRDAVGEPQLDLVVGK